MKAQGIVDLGKAKTNGIGAMNTARIKDLHDAMVRVGLYKAGEVDPVKVAELRCANKRVGLPKVAK